MVRKNDELRLYRVVMRTNTVDIHNDNFMLLCVAKSGHDAKKYAIACIKSWFPEMSCIDIADELSITWIRDAKPALPAGAYDGANEDKWLLLGFAKFGKHRDKWDYDPSRAANQLDALYEKHPDLKPRVPSKAQ